MVLRSQVDREFASISLYRIGSIAVNRSVNADPPSSLIILSKSQEVFMLLLCRMSNDDDDDDVYLQ
jgi:hypothetical protein